MKCVDLVQRVEMIGRFIKEPKRRIFEFEAEQNYALPLSTRKGRKRTFGEALELAGAQ